MWSGRNTLVTLGAILTVLGLIALAVPAFTTRERSDVANIGDVHVTADQEKTHTVPQSLGVGAVAVGLVLMGAGLYARR